MPRGGQVGRLLTIVQDLRQSHRGLPAEILAQRHEWRVRTVYRDLHALEEAGIPITSDGGRWRLVAGWEDALPFPLTTGERVALAFARMLLGPLRATPVGRDFEKLYDRLAGPRAPIGERQALPARSVGQKSAVPAERDRDRGEPARTGRVAQQCSSPSRSVTCRSG